MPVFALIVQTWCMACLWPPNGCTPRELSVHPAYSIAGQSSGHITSNKHRSKNIENIFEKMIVKIDLQVTSLIFTYSHV